ncbi:uncharacterized protein LOC113831894 isoform X2 [Cricetulus griseus]|uniref:Uncharacterized protein LOC113831894 isoform X2 n=1 Tax=Cricetulus griseus TaxID=10029 RepID=A0A9J7GTP4_CRIGR|nr:uncharacterized protein LOC113831894 isoform X2 [Cricetulus griseus]
MEHFDLTQRLGYEPVQKSQLPGLQASAEKSKPDTKGMKPSLIGASSTFAFFFSEKFLRQHFQEVELDQGDPQPGDLYLFQLQSAKVQQFAAHVGVYCGHGEIIHFEGKNPGGSEVEMLVNSCEGVVHKEGLQWLKQSRNLIRVLRKRGGVDCKMLEQRVQNAMSSKPPEYHPTKNNCMHFALGLLGMDSSLAGVYSTLAIFNEAFLMKHFQDVELDQGDPQPGDLYLFQLQSAKVQQFAAHVGVYCGHGEIIHFEGKNPGGSEVEMLVNSCEGVVHKEGLQWLKQSRNLIRVLRKRGGVDCKMLEQRVQNAMSSKPPEYHPTKNNCMHFALGLLGMDSMSMDLDLTRN